MVIGIDMGASAVKIAALEAGEIVLTHYEHGRGGDIPALCERLGLDLRSASAVGVSGLSAKNSGLEALGITPVNVPEAEAIGRLLCTLRPGVSDGFAARRIEALVRKGLLEEIEGPRPGRPVYDRVLRKTGL